MSVLNRIVSAIDWLNDRLGRIICWLTLVMVLVASYNAIARYLGRFVKHNLTSNALLETQWYLFSGVFLLGAAYALQKDAHVRVDVVFDRLSERAQAWINLAGAFIFLLPFCFLLLWSSWSRVGASWAIRELSPDPGGLPRYPVKTLLPIACVLLILQGFAQVVKEIRRLRSPPAKEPGTP